MMRETRYASRKVKAEKILAILIDFLGPDLSSLTCLDIGCSSGGISQHLAPRFKHIIGIDIDQLAISQAQEIPGEPSLNFLLASGNLLPFPDNSFDVAIFAQVYEHTTDKEAVAQEIFRILKAGGVCFFSGPNRLILFEEHYWLPFLSWLPRSLANIYMRLFKRGKIYDVYPLFYWQILRLWNHFRIHDYTIALLRQPDQFGYNDNLIIYSWTSRVPVWVYRLFTPLIPNYNWILVKPS